jgi:uncharacterized membrane protein
MTYLPSRWLVPAGLAVLSLIPVGAAVYRLVDLTGAATAESLRYHAATLATVLHAGGGAIFLTLGPLQLMRVRGHRVMGRIALAAGLAAALSGLWMTMTFPSEPNNDPLIMALRLVFGSGWAVCLILGLQSARQRRFADHRAWMLRAYAIALGAGTTVITFGLWYAATGLDTPLSSALAQLAAWVINLAVAERAIGPRLNRSPT